jgi:AhpD family alkylhydroperoxidase
MSHITPVADEAATEDEAEALAEIRGAWGGVPRLARVIARSLPLTRALLAYGTALGSGRFGGRLTEQIAIAVANENRCAYCLAAHTAAGRALGLDERELADARTGRSADAATQAALSFVQAVVRERGHVSDADLDAARAAGWTDGDLVELVGHAIATTLTNYLHHLSRVPVDVAPVDFADPAGATCGDPPEAAEAA